MIDACANCKSDAYTLFIAPNKKEYCIHCMRKVYPPFMSFMIFDKDRQPTIWNIESARYEDIDSPYDLNLCGWETRMIQELPNGTMFVYMEYFGEAKCGRCGWYEWGLTGSPCLAKACEEHVDRRRGEELLYPNRSNVYLNWKYGS